MTQIVALTHHICYTRKILKQSRENYRIEVQIQTFTYPNFRFYMVNSVGKLA